MVGACKQEEGMGRERFQGAGWWHLCRTEALHCHPDCHLEVEEIDFHLGLVGSPVRSFALGSSGQGHFWEM